MTSDYQVIKDAAAEAAAMALHLERWPDAPWGALNDESRSYARKQARAILEAAAPRMWESAYRAGHEDAATGKYRPTP